MRAIVWLWIALVSIQSQASEIQDAETLRLRAEQQLKTLKRDVQLDAKKLKVIESELNRLNSESKKLTREIASSEQVLRDLSETQQETENNIVSRTADLQRLLDQYRNELVAYYVTGRTLRPNTTDQDHLSEYLPFLLEARQKNAAESKRLPTTCDRYWSNKSEIPITRKKHYSTSLMQGTRYRNAPVTSASY